MKIDRETAQNLSWAKGNEPLPRQVRLERLDAPDETFTVYSNELGDEHRWFFDRVVIFAKENVDGYYLFSIEEGKTEMQDDPDYPEEYECVEVEPYEVLVTKWRAKS